MKFIPNVISSTLARQVLITQKHSPALLFASGIVGMGATVVLACRATLKVEDILDDIDEDLKLVQERRFISGLEKTYAEHDLRKDKAKVYIRAGVELGKLYGPSVLCAAVSVSALAGSHNILSKRNAALAAAYGTIEKAFSEYRERVSSEIGEDREKEIYYHAESCEIEDAKGKKKTIKVATGGSIYARFFDHYNKNWSNMSEYNIMFLKCIQNQMNDRLQSRGHVFLNEVYDDLGLERTKEGQVVGWLRHGTDGYIDFGIFADQNGDALVELLTGRGDGIWLDFNVDGTIYDKI